MNNTPNEPASCQQQELGMPTMPMQHWTQLNDLRTGLKEGTIFPDLDKPFYMGGINNGR